MADESAQNRSKPDLDKEAADSTPKGKVNRIVAIGVAVLLTVIAAGVFFSFRFVEDERQRALNEWQIRLGIVADSRVAAINDWIQYNFATIRDLTENASLQLYLSEISQAQGDANKVTDAAASLGYLRNLLVAVADKTGFGPPMSAGVDVNSNVEKTGIAGLALTDGDGKPLVITPAMPPLTGKLRTGIATALNGTPTVIDMYKGATNMPTAGFALPIYGVQADVGSKGIGVAVGIRVVGDDLFSLLKQPGDTSKTAETYLVRRTENTVEFLTPLADGTAALNRTMAFDTPELADAFAIE